MGEALKAGTGTIGWIDLTVPNAPEVRDFYRDVVGWDFAEVAMGDYCDYSMKLPGTERAVAGVCHAQGENTGLPPQWLIYITVDDLDASLARCRERGGEVLILRGSEGGGRFAVIRDPAGAVAALYMPAR